MQSQSYHFVKKSKKHLREGYGGELIHLTNLTFLLSFFDIMLIYLILKMYIHWKENCTLVLKREKHCWQILKSPNFYSNSCELFEIMMKICHSPNLMQKSEIMQLTTGIKVLLCLPFLVTIAQPF